MERLYQDYICFYNGITEMSQTYMQKILNGYNFDNYFVLQLAFLAGISAMEIAKVPANIKNEQYENLYRKLSEKHNLEYEVVLEIGNEIVRHIQPKITKIFVPNNKEYEKLDEELLPQVKKIVDGLVNRERRP